MVGLQHRYEMISDCIAGKVVAEQDHMAVSNLSSDGARAAADTAH